MSCQNKISLFINKLNSVQSLLFYQKRKRYITDSDLLQKLKPRTKTNYSSAEDLTLFKQQAVVGLNK